MCECVSVERISQSSLFFAKEKNRTEQPVTLSRESQDKRRKEQKSEAKLKKKRGRREDA